RCPDRSMPISSMTATAKGSVSPARTPADSTYMRLPAWWRGWAAAIGERTALRRQAKRTAPGRSACPTGKASSLPVERADEREQASRRGDVDEDLALEPLHEEAAAFVMQAAPSHVDGLDARGRRGLDRLVVALAHQEIILHQPAEG